MRNLRIVVGLCLTFLASPGLTKWENVAGEWEPYKLTPEQKSWFKSVKAQNGVPCCNESDGHPTEMEICQDGHAYSGLKRLVNVCDGQPPSLAYYVPDPTASLGPWLRVPDAALTTPRTNPVGVAVVWYVLQGEHSVYIRCFISEPET